MDFFAGVALLVLAFDLEEAAAAVGVAFTAEAGVDVFLATDDVAVVLAGVIAGSSSLF